MVIPANTFDGTGNSEQFVWELFQRFAYEGLTTYHSLKLSDERYQLIVTTDKGLMLCRIIDYKAGDVKSIDNKRLRLTNGMVVSAPGAIMMEQLNKLVSEISKTMGIDISKHITIGMICPYMTKDEIKECGLCSYVPEKYYISKEILEDQEGLKERVITLFQELCDAQGTIDKTDIEKIDEDFNSKYPKEELEEEEPLVLDLQVVSKKELYYEISSFLLMYDITAGNIISCERTILDGLATYMSERHIPWHYSGTEGMGYRLVDGNVSTTGSEKDIVIEKTGSHMYRVSVGKRLYLPIEVYEAPKEEFDIDKIPLHLRNEQIREVFLKTFDVAQEEIDIISPWMNFFAVDEELIEKMEAALTRGVRIKIQYGLKEGSERFDNNRSARSDQVAEHLSSRFAKYGERFQIQRDNIHYKLVLCDELFKLEGGYNYLSFEGDYTKPDVRKEGSPFGRDKDEIALLRKEYFTDGWN